MCQLIAISLNGQGLSIVPQTLCQHKTTAIPKIDSRSKIFEESTGQDRARPQIPVQLFIRKRQVSKGLRPGRIVAAPGQLGTKRNLKNLAKEKQNKSFAGRLIRLWSLPVDDLHFRIRLFIKLVETFSLLSNYLHIIIDTLFLLFFLCPTTS